MIQLIYIATSLFTKWNLKTGHSKVANWPQALLGQRTEIEILPQYQTTTAGDHFLQYDSGSRRCKSLPHVCCPWHPGYPLQRRPHIHGRQFQDSSGTLCFSYTLFMPSVPVDSMCRACMRCYPTNCERCTTGCSRNWRYSCCTRHHITNDSDVRRTFPPY